jgi:hypothetical protein
LIGVENWKAIEPSRKVVTPIPIINRRIDTTKRVQLITVYE